MIRIYADIVQNPTFLGRFQTFGGQCIYLNPVADLDRWCWGRGRVSEELYSMLQGQLTANSEPDYLKVEQAISLTAESAEACQLVPCSEWIAVNVLMSAIWIADALAGNWKSKDKVSRSQSQRSSAVDAGRGSPARPQSAKTHHSRSGGLWGADLKHTHSRWEESRWRWL